MLLQRAVKAQRSTGCCLDGDPDKQRRKSGSPSRKTSPQSLNVIPFPTNYIHHQYTPCLKCHPSPKHSHSSKIHLARNKSRNHRRQSRRRTRRDSTRSSGARRSRGIRTIACRRRGISSVRRSRGRGPSSPRRRRQTKRLLRRRVSRPGRLGRRRGRGRQTERLLRGRRGGRLCTERDRAIRRVDRHACRCARASATTTHN